MFGKFFSGSWRVKAVGFLGGISLILNQAVAVLDSDPTTVFSFQQLTLAFGMIGLGWFARDNKVSSEQAGAK